MKQSMIAQAENKLAGAETTTRRESLKENN